MATYWLIGPDNTFARVEGAAARDESAAHGWTPHPEPTGYDQVWLQHDVTRAIAPFPYAALEAWQAHGWQHVVPPTEETDQGLMVKVPAPGELAPASAIDASDPVDETPAVTPPPAEEAQSSDKEARRGR